MQEGVAQMWGKTLKLRRVCVTIKGKQHNRSARLRRRAKTMKLGFSTIGCPEWDWAEILGTAKDMGIDGIEIRGVEDELDPMKITIFDK